MICGRNLITRDAAQQPGKDVFTRAEVSSGTRSSPPHSMRGATTGCAGSRLLRRPADRRALRPGADQPGPARHLHRRRLHRRSSPLAATPGRHAVWPPLSGQTARTPHARSPLATNSAPANRRYGRQVDYRHGRLCCAVNGRSVRGDAVDRAGALVRPGGDVESAGQCDGDFAGLAQDGQLAQGGLFLKAACAR